jgi:hypothetical protein
MYAMKKNYIYLILFLFAFVSCEPEIEDYSISSGEADFSSYVAVGNSLTAGFMNGELYKTGQENSYSNILAQKFQAAGGGDFKQPLMTDDLGFGGKLKLGMSTDCKGTSSLAPVPAGGTPSQQNFASIASQGPFNNMGVPGAKSFHLLAPGYGTLNPYFQRFASDPTTTTVIADAMLNQPTFFTCWIGNNDVLTYATAGGEADSITEINLFTQALGGIIQTLTSEGATGAIANIPDITDIPFFTTVPYNAISLDESQADQLNVAYAQYNMGAQAAGLELIEFDEGANAMIIEDDAPIYQALGGIRQIKSNELVLLTIPQDSLKCAGWGTQKPVPDEYILDSDEIADITGAVLSYNQTISSVASTYDLALVDIAGFMSDIKENGLKIDGVNYSTAFVTGGLFSLDGIHLTAQGYAIVANEFIKAINTKFNASVPEANVIDYPGIQFP